MTSFTDDGVRMWHAGGFAVSSLKYKRFSAVKREHLGERSLMEAAEYFGRTTKRRITHDEQDRIQFSSINSNFFQFIFNFNLHVQRFVH